MVGSGRRQTVFGGIDIWLVPCDGADDPEAYDILSEAERGRADAFVFPEHRRRFIRAHSSLRQVLSCYTAIAEGAIRFGSGKKGKPCLENSAASPFSFNLSHSGDLAVVAVGGVSEIGVDIEQVRPAPDWEEIAKGTFRREEAEWVRAAAVERRAGAFFEVWTAKEAYVKANGHGLAHMLHSVSVVGANSQREYLIASLQLPEGYVGAVAYPPPRSEIRRRWWKGKQNSRRAT
jgi:phosphopantetheinyl transferase